VKGKLVDIIKQKDKKNNSKQLMIDLNLSNLLERQID